ncbi:MAG: HK97 family phage prohead protease, partial [Rhodospirillales bacterium]|nr:HK97 family phage prohead protease [Rhodospirillales bacterium]
LRTTRPFELKFAASAKAGQFSGYGAVFDNIDDGGDRIVKGAFAASLADWKARGKMPKMLWQHGLGASTEDMMPVGYWTALEEDDHGLKVEGQLDPIDTERGRTLFAGLKNGSIDAMSITYVAVDYAYGKTAHDPFRTIARVDLYEVGPVLWGMNQFASIDEAKAAYKIKTIREFETFLRDAGGFSIADAKAIASGGFKAKPLRDEGGADALDVLRERAAGLFKTT